MVLFYLNFIVCLHVGMCGRISRMCVCTYVYWAGIYGWMDGWKDEIITMLASPLIQMHLHLHLLKCLRSCGVARYIFVIGAD